MRLSKRERQQEIEQRWQDNPFVTDEEMAAQFDVSVQTIRLDRMELGIPEMRERIKSMAEQTYDQVRSLPPEEVIGEIIDLELDHHGISMFVVGKEHVFSRNQIARGHHLFAQANSLAIALINEEMALTAKSTVRFLKPVVFGNQCVAKAKVINRNSGRSKVAVETHVSGEKVFDGTFDIFHGPSERVKQDDTHRT